jgi:riboflavin-specific deaminase-like protein
MELFNRRLAEARQHRLRTGRPLVSLCFAQSLDGSLSARRGEPLALSGPASLAVTHQLRAHHDAILVGIGTVLADNPQLTVRLVEGRNPQVVVLDSRLQIPASSNLLEQRRPWLAAVQVGSRAAELEAAGARLLHLPPDERGRVSLPDLLDCLGELGIDSLMVEGGARVLTNFLAQGLADQAALTIAPILVGGLNLLQHPLEVRPGSGYPRLVDIEIERLQDDLLVFGRLG